MVGVVTQSTQVEKQLKEVFRLEARIVLLRILHTAKEETAADEGDESDSSLGNHKQAAQAVVGPTESAAAAAELQDLIQIGVGSLDGRDDAEDEAGQNGDKQ